MDPCANSFVFIFVDLSTFNREGEYQLSKTSLDVQKYSQIKTGNQHLINILNFVKFLLGETTLKRNCLQPIAAPRSPQKKKPWT